MLIEAVGDRVHEQGRLADAVLTVYHSHAHRPKVKLSLRIAAVVLDLDLVRDEGSRVLPVVPAIVRFLDDRFRQDFEPVGLVAGDVVVLQPAAQGLKRAVVFSELVFRVQLLHVLRDDLGDVERTVGSQRLLDVGPVQSLFLLCRAGIAHPDDLIPYELPKADALRVCNELGHGVRRESQRQVFALRQADEAGRDGVAAHHRLQGVEPKTMLRALVVEIQLVHAAAVIGRSFAGKTLGLVDVSETGKVNACCVDRGGQNHHVLSRQEGAAVVRFAAAHGVVGGHDSRDAVIELRCKAQNRVVYEGCRVAVLLLLVHARVEQAQAGFIEARNSHDLHRAFLGVQLLDRGRGVDVQIAQVLGRLLNELEGTGVVVVHGAEQQHHLVAAPAQRNDELLQGVVYVVQSGVSPDAGAVEQIASDDRNLRLDALRILHDRFHAADRVQAAEVFAVFCGTCQVAQVDVTGMQYPHFLPPLALRWHSLHRMRPKTL